jgi:multiphosphoryl transfer protein
VEAEWAGLPDPYLRERAADVRAVAEQVLQVLTGQTARRMSAAGVLVAEDLTPAETAALDLDLVSGVILAHGSPTSHAAILARARDIPVVVSAGRDVLGLAEGTTVVVDGSTGVLHVAPSAEVVEDYRRRARELAERNAAQLAHAEQPAVSRDGTAFTVAANLGSVADARLALVAGADGAGLVRTEFLFLDRSEAPTVEEQRAAYDELAQAMGGRRVTLRTLDVGGDKPLAYLPMPSEANPFLGQRGIRLSLEHRDLLRDQLTAMCETARRFPVDIMFPMLTTPGELVEARQVLTDAAGPSGLPDGLRVGTMIEVPAAALKIEAFLPHVDFVSIGTNDLTQYAMAAERGNGAVASLSDPLDPGVLRLIDHVCRATRGRIDVAVCGEAASDELAVPVLAGLGVHELSVSPAAVPRVKAAVRELDVARCTAVAGQALELADAGHVRKLVLEAFGESQG